MPTRNLSKLGGLQILVRSCVCLYVLITNMLTPKVLLLLKPPNLGPGRAKLRLAVPQLGL